MRKLTFIFLLFSAIVCKGQNKEVLTIYFASNSREISTKYEQKLEKIIDLCNSEKFIFLKVFAYSDTTGTEEYNELISKQRGYKVLNYISNRTNIDQNKIYMTWLGESRDVYDLHFEDAHPQERCVDILVQLKK